MSDNKKPHIVLIIARGEAVRNFLFSDTLPILSNLARVTLLSTVDHGEVIQHVKPHVERVVPLKAYKENSFITTYRNIIHTAHYRWLWSEAVKYYWRRHDERVRNDLYEKIKLITTRILAAPMANQPMLQLGTKIDRYLSWRFRPTHHFDRIFEDIKPDLVFNCSHIHGALADLPTRIAHEMGIPTATFVFSWDNLTSRSRIHVPYDYYLMWNEGMKSQLLEMYPEIQKEQVFVTGTPQFDYHFKDEYILPYETLCEKVGLDPKRRFILYTTGRSSDFPEEHRIVNEVIRYIKGINAQDRPQLLVRTYIKGTSEGMKTLAKQMENDPDVVFPSILWDPQWIMPLREDLYVYTSLLHHTLLGINVASTVSLELMALDKPVINLGFEPPGTNLPFWTRFSRHVDYDHYRPVADSGGVMVARSMKVLLEMIDEGLKNPKKLQKERLQFISDMFNNLLDGNAGKRTATLLAKIASKPIIKE